MGKLAVKRTAARQRHEIEKQQQSFCQEQKREQQRLKAEDARTLRDLDTARLKLLEKLLAGEEQDKAGRLPKHLQKLKRQPWQGQVICRPDFSLFPFWKCLTLHFNPHAVRPY